MASTKSDLTSRNFQSRPLREIEVPDDSEQLYDYSQEQIPMPSQNDLEAMNAHLASRGFPPLNNNGMRAVEAKKSFNATSDVASIEDNIREARKVKATGRERLSQAAKQRIEALCGMFDDIKEIDLNGKVFVIRLLNGKELKEVFKTAYHYDGKVELPFETRRQYLARSLVKIGGIDIETFLGDDSLEAREELAESLPEPILNILYNEYLKFSSEVNEKNSIKNEKDAQEVVADLKK